MWIICIVEQEEKKKEKEKKTGKNKRRKSRDVDEEAQEDEEDGEEDEGTESMVAKWGVGGINRPVMRANKKYSLCPLHIAIEGGHLVGQCKKITLS